MERIHEIVDDLIEQYCMKYEDWYNTQCQDKLNYNDPEYERKRVHYLVTELKYDLINFLEALQNF